jgi:hypothetical protein
LITNVCVSVEDLLETAEVDPTMDACFKSFDKDE